jgi:hypothetical protein
MLHFACLFKLVYNKVVERICVIDVQDFDSSASGVGIC